MKVFKERKAGLLYLLKRGLVVLSILALAFALAGCGNGNNGGNDLPPPPPPPPPPGPGPEPTAPFVQRLTLLNEDLFAYSSSGTDMRVGFQGFAPNLEGAFLRMEWNDGRDETIHLTRNHPEWNNFYTFPPAPDIGGSDTGELLWIRHTSMPSGARSANPFRIDHVVHLHGFGVSFPGQTWYADQRPDQLDDFTAAGTWFWLATASDPNPPTVGTRPVVINNRPAPGMDFIFVASAPASISDIISVRGNVNDPGQPWHQNPRFVEVNAALSAETLVPEGIYFVEEFSQGMPFSIDYPVLDFSEAMSPPYRIGVVIGSTDRRPAPDLGYLPGPEQRHVVRTVITVPEFLYVQNVTLESMNNFRFYDDQFRDAIRDLDGEMRHLQRDDVRDAIFQMLDEGNTMLRIHYTHGRSRVITWGQFQANRAWWDNVTGNTGGGTGPDGNARPVFHRNMIWEAAGALVEDHQDPWRNGLIGGDTWGFTLTYVGRSFVEPGNYIRFTPSAPVYTFSGFPENAVQRRFAAAQSNPSFRQRRPDAFDADLTLTPPRLLPGLGNLEFLTSVGLVAARDFPDNGRPYTVDGRPRTIRQIPGLLDDINNHYTLTGLYTRAGGEPRPRQMTFVAGMFDTMTPARLHDIFPAWPAENWARPDLGENPTLTNWLLPIAWRGHTTTGVYVDVVAEVALHAPTPIRSVQFWVNPLGFQISQLATPGGVFGTADINTLATVSSTPRFAYETTNPVIMMATAADRTFPQGQLSGHAPGGTGSYVISWSGNANVPVLAGVQRTLSFRLAATPSSTYIFSDDVAVQPMSMNAFTPQQLDDYPWLATSTEFTFGTLTVNRNPTAPAPLLPRNEILVSLPVTARHVIPSVTLPTTLPIASENDGVFWLATRGDLMNVAAGWTAQEVFGDNFPPNATITDMGWALGDAGALGTRVMQATSTDAQRVLPNGVYSLFVTVSLGGGRPNIPAAGGHPELLLVSPTLPVSTHTFSAGELIGLDDHGTMPQLGFEYATIDGSASTVRALAGGRGALVGTITPATIAPATGATGRHTMTLRFIFMAPANF